MGEADAAVYFPQPGKSAKVWDYAAALLMIEELGGSMTTLGGLMMPFREQAIVHRDGWLASNAFCNHAEILKALR
ncbi:MAG: hypothetical protein HY755_10790 [Nitrospirae bacterium]|nr:hypothetical protein [Nitrospirota bacterium]